MRVKFCYMILACVCMLSACKRVTVTLEKVPKNTPKGAQIYITGSFNNWNPGDPNYQLMYDEMTQRYTVNLPLGFGNIDYKFTRGDWSTVETDPCGGETQNRRLRYADGSLFMDTIVGWKDLEPENCERVTLIINKLPENTPPSAKIYLGGNINAWECNDNRFLFKPAANGFLVLTVPRNSDRLVFKITRGTWESAELNETGDEQLQRELLFGQKDTVYLSVNAWADMPLERIYRKTIVIESIPKQTGKQDLFLATSLNNWNPLDSRYKFLTMPNGKRMIQIGFTGKEPIQYKITRGGWETVETNIQFEEIENREIRYSDKDTVYIQVANWADKAPSHVRAKQLAEQNIPGIKSGRLTVSPTIPNPQPVEAGPIDFDKRKKVFIILERVPDFGKDNPMYLAGDFNGWSERDENYRFRNLPNGKKYLLLRLDDWDRHEYKITRGSWDREEANADGSKPGNRVISAKTTDDTIRVYIQRWFDETEQQKLVMVLNQIPENTPVSEPLYLCGDFNNWNVRDEAFRFKRLSDGRYVLVISDFSKRYNLYKITRGDWGTEATTKNGRVPGNQQFRPVQSDTIKVRIERWKDL